MAMVNPQNCCQSFSDGTNDVAAIPRINAMKVNTAGLTRPSQIQRWTHNRVGSNLKGGRIRGPFG
jgi:hypothetical protein